MKLKMYNSATALLATATILLVISGCAGAPDLPGWVERYPSEGNYYIGIGSSNSGNQSRDLDLAREEALANLAASISTTIVAEVELESGESGDGESFSSMRRKISERVYQTIEGAEVVDSYYSPKEGYWIYLRYSRQELERQKRAVAERVVESIAPVFGEAGLPVDESLRLLQRGHELLLESPYFATLRGRIAGEERILLDRIEEETAALLAGVEIRPGVERLDGEAGDEALLSLSAENPAAVGTLPFVITLGDERIAEDRLDPDGSARITVDLGRLPLGRGSLSIEPDLKALGIDPETYFLGLPRSTRSLAYEVRPLRLGFAVEYADAVEVPGIDGMAASLFSRSGAPFSLADTVGENGYLLRLRLIVEDFPKYKENSLEISQARVVLQLERGAEILYAWESEAMKDGGLTISQAHERTVKKLFSKLEAEQAYLPGLIEALPIRLDS